MSRKQVTFARHTVRNNGRHGITLIYTIVSMVVLCGMVSLSVDYGRVQLAKAELGRAADAAARAGAAGLVTSRSTAIQLAQQYAGLNKVDGKPLVLDSTTDIELLYVDPKTYKVVKNSSRPANAVHVTAVRNAKRGNAIPMMFASILGFNSCTVSAECIALLIPPVSIDQDIAATANPFLSGMPAGSVASAINPHKNPDYAGSSSNMKQSPTLVAIPVEEGDVLTFDDINGNARHDPSDPYYSPDGQLNDIGHNNLTTNYNNNYSPNYYNENGIADARIPINALVGLFLDDNQPSFTNAPSKNLDFSSSTSRDFQKLTPDVKQIFFIGDGQDSSSNKQQFIVPKGATRLYLATWDFYEWNNNAGSREIVINRPMRIITIK